jgi:hypothetical protein
METTQRQARDRTRADGEASRKEPAMPTATFASITCQTCSLTSTVPVDALLVSVAVDEPRPSGPFDADRDADTAADSADSAGTVAWTCDACSDLSTAHLDWPALLTLVTAGATLLDAATLEDLPPHPEHPAAGARLTHDDLLALHELLTTDTWFDQVTAAGCVNP